MLRRKMNAKIINATKFSDERAYKRRRSLEDSMVKVFQRLVDCRMISKASDATISVPMTQGVLRRFGLLSSFSTCESLA